jgi:hypothetical protein
MMVALAAALVVAAGCGAEEISAIVDGGVDADADGGPDGSGESSGDRQASDAVTDAGLTLASVFPPSCLKCLAPFCGGLLSECYCGPQGAAIGPGGSLHCMTQPRPTDCDVFLECIRECRTDGAAPFSQPCTQECAMTAEKYGQLNEDTVEGLLSCGAELCPACGFVYEGGLH